MTYQEAIEGAKKVAKVNKESCIVYWYPKKHWWQRRSYCYTLMSIWRHIKASVSVTKLLTITPNGTISQ